jgi:hypothetical protein
MVPKFDNAFFGVRYQYRTFHTQIAGDKTQFSNDYFQTIELWGGLNLGKRWQVLAFVPYNINKQVSDDGKKRSNGLGDIAAIINYSLVEKTSLTRNNKLIFQQVWVGAGIKAPTGISSIDPGATDIIALANSQLGSGSTDFLLNTAYTIKINKTGFTTNLGYKINTKNKENYMFGNRFSVNSFIHYSINRHRATLIPNLGILYEHANANKLSGQNVDQTNGYATLGAAGMEISLKKLSIGFNIQAPLKQDFASGQTKAKFRTMLHFTFAL